MTNEQDNLIAMVEGTPTAEEREDKIKEDTENPYSYEGDDYND